MLKIIFLSFLLFMVSSPYSVLLLMFGLVGLMTFLEINTLSWNLSIMSKIDTLSILMIMLTIYLLILMVTSQIKTKYISMLNFLFVLLLFTLIMSFTTCNTIMFYFWFESSLLPIFMIISGWGYQPERLLAGISMFFYTLFASLPMLMTFVCMVHSGFSSTMCSLLILNTFNCKMNFMFKIFMILAFLVKFPMYSVHLWLPKAHVEAPVSGSMILAGVLLKLGGYGMIRFYFMNDYSMNLYIFCGLTLMGASLLSMLCMVNSDMKVVIAYSSVVHMALVISGLLSLSLWGMEGGFMIMVAHGICSSGMFFGANLMYERSHSRSYFLNSGWLSISPAYSMLWFMLMVSNFGGPFTLNLMGEIVLIINLMTFNKMLLFSVVCLSLFSAGYSLILYSTTQQGQCNSIMVTIFNYEVREYMIMLAHVWPVFMLPVIGNIV